MALLLVLALLLPALPGAGQAQTYDAQRGVWSVRDAINKAVPATVRIDLGANRDYGAGAGTGVVVDAANGYIITNHHVISEPGGFRIRLNDGRSLKAEIVGSDQRADLALLKVKAGGLRQIELADADRIEMGDMVIALGFPYGLPLSSSLGIVSAKAEPVQGTFDETRNSIQTDAAVNPGNSGGPLIDSQGRLIGINSSIQGGADGSFAGIAFAIPSNVVAHLVERLSKGRSRIALTGKSLTDRLAAAAAPETDEAPQFSRLFADREAGPGRRFAFAGTFGAPQTSEAVERPVRKDHRRLQQFVGSLDAAGGRLGLVVEDLTPRAARAQRLKTNRGAYVVKVAERSPAKAAGLLPGDTIVRIDDASIGNASELQDNVQARQGRNFDITFYRRSKLLTTSLAGED